MIWLPKTIAALDACLNPVEARVWKERMAFGSVEATKLWESDWDDIICSNVEGLGGTPCG